VMTLRVLLLAHPAGHSLSPAMQGAALRACGIDARYLALDVPPRALAEAVAGLRAPDVAGANVTIPHKRAVMPWLDGLTDVARAVGAVNTIVRTQRGLLGDNTDGEGFLRALAELGVTPAGLSTVVLGAGGAARAVTLALLQAGARVTIHNRTRARAERLATDLAVHGAPAVAHDGVLEPAVRSARLLVQATAAGMQGAAEGVSPLPEGVLPEEGAVVDLVYRPRETPLLARARAAGLSVQNGLPMLVHQGALAFERWFGRDAPVDVMRRAAEDALG
jgi:shikimate dehydrogenase